MDDTHHIQVLVSTYVEARETHIERYLVPKQVFNASKKAEELFDQIRNAKSQDRYQEDLTACDDPADPGPLNILLHEWEKAGYLAQVGWLETPVLIAEEFYLEGDEDDRWVLWEKRSAKRKRDHQNDEEEKARIVQKPKLDKEVEEENEDWEYFSERYVEDEEDPMFDNSLKTRDQFHRLRKPCLEAFGYETMSECSDARERMRDVMLMINGREPSGLGLECTVEEREMYQKVIDQVKGKTEELTQVTETIDVFLEHASFYSKEFTKFLLVKIVDSNLVDGTLTGKVKHAIFVKSDPQNFTVAKSHVVYGSENTESIDQRPISEVCDEKGYALVKHYANLQTLFQLAQYKNSFGKAVCQVVAQLKH